MHPETAAGKVSGASGGWSLAPCPSCPVLVYVTVSAVHACWPGSRSARCMRRMGCRRQVQLQSSMHVHIRKAGVCMLAGPAQGIRPLLLRACGGAGVFGQRGLRGTPLRQRFVHGMGIA